MFLVRRRIQWFGTKTSTEVFWCKGVDGRVFKEKKKEEENCALNAVTGGNLKHIVAHTDSFLAQRRWRESMARLDRQNMKQEQQEKQQEQEKAEKMKKRKKGAAISTTAIAAATAATTATTAPAATASS